MELAANQRWWRGKKYKRRFQRLNINGKEIQESRPKIEHQGERKKERKKTKGWRVVLYFLLFFPAFLGCHLPARVCLVVACVGCCRCCSLLPPERVVPWLCFCFSSSRATIMDVFFFISISSSSCSCSSSPTTPAASVLRLRGVSLLVIIALSGGEFFCLCVFLCPLLCVLWIT